MHRKKQTNGLYALAGKGGRETRHLPRNRLSIHLPNGALHGNHIAARGFRGMAGLVLVELCLAHPEHRLHMIQRTSKSYLLL